MDKNIIEIIEGVHKKCSKLEFDSLQDIIEIFAVLGLNSALKFGLRVWDKDLEENEVYINRVSDLLNLSRGDIRRLIKGQGLKINNKVISPETLLSDLPWISLGDWKICVIKKGKNEFDFILS